jgi:branched-chain amino acid transport system ATP-binding protein
MEILTCTNIAKRFGGLEALADVSFSVQQGEILGLIGPNGAGKTTLFNIISGLYKPTFGEVKFKTEVISGRPPHKICKKGIARTFQIPQPFKGLTVFENVSVGSHFGKHKSTPAMKALEVIEFVELEQLKDTLVENLTISDQKRVEIAKSLATGPEVLLLDEVAAGLNPAEQDDLGNLVREIRGRLNITVVMVEHIMKTVMGLSSRVLVLDMGKVLTIGDPESVGKDKRVVEAYLGEEYVGNSQD